MNEMLTEVVSSAYGRRDLFVASCRLGLYGLYRVTDLLKASSSVWPVTSTEIRRVAAVIYVFSFIAFSFVYDQFGDVFPALSAGSPAVRAASFVRASSIIPSFGTV